MAFSQEDFLAKRYFDDGEFDKAVVFYEKLVNKNPGRNDYGEHLVSCYQQLERYNEAEEFLLKALGKAMAYPTLYIELGYNYTLKGMPEKSMEYYNAALDKVSENPNFGYGIGYRFQKYALLDFAIKAYSKAMELNPQLDYNLQMARIYGEQGDIGKMYGAYLRMLQEGKVSSAMVLHNINAFIGTEAEGPNNLILKKMLIQHAQNDPDVLWNELLGWLFVRQKQYGSAFVQEKAILKRSGERSFHRLEGLGKLAREDGELDVAKEIYTYIAQSNGDPVTALNAQLGLIEMELQQGDEKRLVGIGKTFSELLEVYGYRMETLQLQIAYANFLTFNMDSSKSAIEILEKCLELPLDPYGIAYIKNALGDILVYDRQFNRALIYFSQIQKGLKNDVLGQEAVFKVARTSFYNGDFDWALAQLKVLRASTSQLIANDAMQLSLLISDNLMEDTTRVALKKYARADFLDYQNKKKEAVALLDEILENHKGEKIEDEALLKQGEILTDLKAYERAEFNYLKITEFYADDILSDDAHFLLAELYRTVLGRPEKAMAHYEKIIYNHPDSYYFPQARKYFRQLRGDAVN